MIFIRVTYFTIFTIAVTCRFSAIIIRLTLPIRCTFDTKVIFGKRQLIKRWLLSDDRIIKGWGSTRIAGIDPGNPRVEITITPMDIAPDQETDPYIVKKIREQSEQSLF